MKLCGNSRAIQGKLSIEYFTRQNDIPVAASLCPEDKNTEREEMKKLLHELEKKNKGIRHRIFVAISKAGLDGYREV